MFYAPQVDVSDVSLVVDGQETAVSAERDPSALTWRDAGADVVIESTGKFRSRATAGKHLSAGTRTVIISAPGNDVDTTIVIGVNEKSFDPQQHRVISNASCTTNCVAPMAKVLQDAFGIERAFMTTVHAYTTIKRLGRAAQGSSPPAVGRRQHHPATTVAARAGIARFGRSARRCGAAVPVVNGCHPTGRHRLKVRPSAGRLGIGIVQTKQVSVEVAPLHKAIDGPLAEPVDVIVARASLFCVDTGSGPAVIVIHELPGIYPGMIEFARRLIGESYTV